MAPARIHGDLWAGNVLFTQASAVMIDPAAHGGHPHTDLGMLALFDAPFLAEIFAGYGFSAGEFLPVHALTHGSGYYGELGRAARAVVKLLS